MNDIKSGAQRWLRAALGPDAQFREGQWEAVEALVARRARALVVQRTGWGKSLVYFAATRLLRDQGAGPTILISPLLALMRNQIEAASAWGLRAASINSSNRDEHFQAASALLADELDLLLISPERLANDGFRDGVWAQIRHRVGLLVIDEAHCISDWGHDFRPDYRRIMSVLDELPPRTPVLGTTATANDRVVADVGEILGATMNIQRGPLTRDSLLLYTYREPLDHATRLTLLAHLMHSIPGSGIIYCMTTRDCRIVAEWLRGQGHNVQPYYSGVEQDIGLSRVDLEDALLHNRLKALVASVALGMGFDKPDLHFVVHYQLPGSIIGYYQQIGRAGRGINRAHIVLMHGPGDDDIQRHFIDDAFPTPRQVEATIGALRGTTPATLDTLQDIVNVKRATLEKILTHLEVEKIVAKEGRGYRLIAPGARPDYARWKGVTAQRDHEMAQMRAYVEHDGCLMRFIAEALDDPDAPDACGRCKNCRGHQSRFQPTIAQIEAAQHFLRAGRPITLEPRKRWPKDLVEIVGQRNTAIRPTNEVGVALCNYFDAGWAAQVKQGRLTANHYSDALVEASAALLRAHFATLDKPPTWATYVPSQRRWTLVHDFAHRLAAALSLPLHTVIVHDRQHPEQQSRHNSAQKAKNVAGVFALAGRPGRQPVLLIDDIADSGWTLTMIGHLLRKGGSGPVHPFVLATLTAG